ncbi:MAG: hypothetical protein ACSHXJ_13005 [Marinomonas colpomeniae]
MKKIHFIVTVLITQFLYGCSAGDLRSLNDSLSEQNGYQVTYPDQSDTDYTGDIRWTTGVKNGQGFQDIKNIGEDYCKVRVEYEDGNYDYFDLDPGEGSGSNYMSIYNQSVSMRTLCGSESSVFSESF